MRFKILAALIIAALIMAADIASRPYLAFGGGSLLFVVTLVLSVLYMLSGEEK